MYTYATNHDLRTEKQDINFSNENIKPENGTELNFTLKFKIQNQHFLEEYHRFFS